MNLVFKGNPNVDWVINLSVKITVIKDIFHFFQLSNNKKKIDNKQFLMGLTQFFYCNFVEFAFESRNEKEIIYLDFYKRHKYLIILFQTILNSIVI